MHRLAPLAVLLVTLAGCAPSIAPFSERAYEQAVLLKVESLALMDKATEPFDEHRADIEALRLKLETAHEFAAGRPKNEISTRLWTTLLAEENNLLGGFLNRWEVENTLSRTFVREAKQGLVAPAFDTIIGLESGKLRPDALE